MGALTVAARVAGTVAGAVVARLTTDPRWPERRRVASSARSLAGVTVTPDTAIKNGTVWACIRYLTQSVAVLPWHVMRLEDTGGKLAGSHPVDFLLYRRPNPDWSAFQFRETLMHWALRWGNGYAEIERGPTGLPIALWPIHPDRVLALRDPDTNALFYRVYNGAVQYTDLQPMDMFHVRGFGEDVVGVNVVAYAAESIGWAQAVQLFGSSFFGNGMNPTGVVELKGELKPGGWTKMKQEFRDAFYGVRRERTVFLDNGATYKPISIEPEKAQFLGTNEFLVTEICRWFGVPPSKVAQLTRATFSNVESQSIEVVIDSVVPWVKRFEEEADYKLFGANRPGYYTKMSLNALMRGDSAARATYYQMLRNAGVLTANDILRAEDMNTVSAAQGGDMLVMQGQYVPLSQIGKAPAPPPAPAAPDPAQGQLANVLAETLARWELEDAA